MKLALYLPAPISLTKSTMQRVDYDQIAHLYDEPSRDHAPDPALAEYLDEHASLNGSDVLILDVGCGTGKQLRANREAYPRVKMIGVDLFHGMLRQARRRDASIAWIQGDGACLPLKSGIFDYAINQYSYAHIQNKPAFLSEIHRALKTRGWFTLVNIDPWSMRDWILYRYFPAAWEMDEQDFLPVPQLTEMMEQAGFADVRVQRERRERMENLKDFLDFASQRHRASHFMALSDDAYYAGVQQIRRELQESLAEVTLIDSGMCFITIRGKKC